MADTDNLQITLSAVDAGASSVMQQALAIVKQLDETVGKMGTSGKKAGSDVNEGAQQAKKGLDDVQKAALDAAKALGTAGEATKKLGAESEAGGLKTFADHTRMATMGLDAMGLEAAATAARVGGLLDVLDQAKAALPALIGIGAAIGVVATAGGFLKDSVEAAGKFDQSMTELGQTVRNQGGDWNALSASVLAWADLQERTTQYSRTEAIDALRKLTASGMALADAQKSVRIAEDASAATGKSLSDVVQGLMEAEHGRTQILSDLGVATRAQIKDGMSYNQVLEIIEKNMGGAAQAATTTLPGALDQLHNAFETFEQDAGEKFQGVMTDIVHDLSDVVEAMDRDLMPELQKFADWAQSELPAAESEIGKLWDALRSGADAVKVGLGWVIDHKDEIEAFFDVVIAVKAIQAVNGLKVALIAAAAEGGTLGLVIETLGSVLTVGLIPTLQAVVASLGEIITEETLATAGINLLVAGAIAGVIYAFTHWQQVSDDLKEALNACRFAIGDWISALGDALNKLPGWIPWVHGLAQEIQNTGNAMQDASLQYQQAQSAVKQSDLSQRMATDERIISGGGKVYVDPAHAGWTVAQAQADLNAALAQMHGAPPHSSGNPPDTKTNVKGKIGGGSGSGTGYLYTPTQDRFANESQASVASTDAQIKALDPLVRLKGQLAAQEETLTRAMKMSTTQQQYDAAALALRNKQIADALTYEKALNNAVAEETAQQQKDVAAVNSTHDAYERARAKLDAFNQTLQGKTKLTAADKEEQKQLEQAVKNAASAHEGAKKALDHVNAALNTHIGELTQARQHYTDLKDAADETIPDLQRKWDDFVDKQQQTQAEDLATFQMSNAQKVAYYQQMVASITATDNLSLQEKEQYYQKWTQAFTGMLKDQENAHKQFTDQAEKLTSTFLDDIVEKHKSFKDEFKTIWDDIVKIFIDDVAKMIVESALFKNVFSNLAPGLGGSGGFNPLALLGLGAMGSSGAAPGSYAAFSAASSQAAAQAFDSLTGVPGTTAANALHVNIAGVSPSVSGASSPLFTASGGLSVLGAAGVGLGAFGLGSAIGGFEGRNTGAAGTHSLWGGIGALAGVAGLGLGVGALTAGTIVGGGGLLGGLGLLAAAGPAGWAALAGAAVVGGLAGGQLGPHWAPGTFPDRDPNTALSWGQDNANLWGATKSNPMNANGQQYTMDPTLSQATGGMGLLQYLGKYIADNPDQAKTVLGASLVSIFQGEDVAKPIPNGHNGTLDLANGDHINWQTLYQDAMDAFNKVQGQGGAAGSTPAFTLTRLYPDYNLATVKDASGNTVIAPGKPAGPNSGMGNTLDKGNPAGLGDVHPIGGVHNDFSGAIFVGPGGMEDAASIIAQALRRLNNGELAGSYRATLGARNRGGDWGE